MASNKPSTSKRPVKKRKQFDVRPILLISDLDESGVEESGSASAVASIKEMRMGTWCKDCACGVALCAIGCFTRYHALSNPIYKLSGQININLPSKRQQENDKRVQLGDNSVSD